MKAITSFSNAIVNSKNFERNVLSQISDFKTLNSVSKRDLSTTSLLNKKIEKNSSNLWKISGYPKFTRSFSTVQVILHKLLEINPL